MKLLIVDDAMVNLITAKDTIERAGIVCEIVLCSTGEAALEVIEKEEFDIILLDIVLPKLSGIDVLQIIREQQKYQNIQIIMFTSLTDKYYLQKSFELGAIDFVTKPIEPTEFVARIKSVMWLKETLDKVNTNNKKLTDINKMLCETQFQLIQKEKLSSIGQLAAGIAHEINNPLAFVSSNFETLEKYVARFKQMFDKCHEIMSVYSTDQEESSLPVLLQEIQNLRRSLRIDFILNDVDALMKESKEGIRRVTDIVQSIRNFARQDNIDAFSYVDINELIKESLFIIKNEAKYVVDIETDLGKLLPIFCHRGQIGQVILNVIVNAVQAVKGQQRSSHGVVTIKSIMMEEYVMLEIQDDGPGIAPKVINKIFDPFFTTKEVGVGTGLGLSISHDIVVNKHKGDIRVDSIEGKGTTFFIKLPSQLPTTLKG